MDRKIIHTAAAALTVLLCVSCAEERVERAFPLVEAPAVMCDEKEILDYRVTRFWDGFFSAGEEKYLCDSIHINGVKTDELLPAVGLYARMLEMKDLASARKILSGMFTRMEEYATANPEAGVGGLIPIVEEVLYNPVSPLRDEDIYSPFAAAVATSALCPEGKKAYYENQAEKSALNCRGTASADFRFIDTEGRTRTLYGTDAEYTVLVFINPGCHACGDAVEVLGKEEILKGVKSGRLNILGIYIDEDVGEWMDKTKDLPREWICGYDPDLAIRNGTLYDVRAIPSAYLLDRDKKVLLKDAELEMLENFLLDRI